MQDEYSFDSCIRGHHVSKEFWTPSLNERLLCEKEEGNTSDVYAVAVKENNRIVGHVPRTISAVCSLFLDREGTTITCVVTGSRRYSSDLPQGGLEVPCKLTFKGSEKYLQKIKLFFKASCCHNSDELSSKRRKIANECSVGNSHEKDSGDLEKQWIATDKVFLTLRDKHCLESGEKLNDNLVNFAQVLLKQQFQSLGGLVCTLTLSRQQSLMGITLYR